MSAGIEDGVIGKVSAGDIFAGEIVKTVLPGITDDAFFSEVQ
ncbi:unknown [Odoribacter sp. CAG:788]|nr:unknown [Odoribacter sp. CAG:788]